MILQRTTPTNARPPELAAARSAFTLMEMLIVVAIIVALAGLGGYYFLGQLNESKKKIASTQVKGTLTTAVTTYNMNHSRWPGSLQELMVRDGQGGPYLKSSDALIDPWGNPYQYNPSGQNPETGEQEAEIFTFAPDGTRISNLGPTIRPH